MDLRSGYCPETKTYYSLRDPVPLPPPTQPLSISAYVLSLLRSPPVTPPHRPAFIDATGRGAALSYPEFLAQVRALASSLSSQIGVSKGHVAFVLSPTRLEIPVLYFALLSLGAVVSPSNPASTTDEVARQFHLTNPTVAFATSAHAHKLPHHVRSILIDSPNFLSVLRRPGSPPPEPEILQSDTAAILYSSGTTGRVKAVVLTHRNFIAIIGHHYFDRLNRDRDRDHPAVGLFTVPLFHVFGFFFVFRVVALGETTVLMERFDFRSMLQAVERYRVEYMPVSPPLVVALAKSDEVDKYDLSSLEVLGCGGAPLGREVAERFTARFPNVQISQGYGLTESSGGATGTSSPEEHRVYGSTGRLISNMEAKIVDPDSGEGLPPGEQGELWLRGPMIMQGYLGDKEATISTLDSEGWLKTGDLCYFDHNGFLFVVDRLKELIKYKAYQVPPAELEHILHSHPEIVDAAVIPYPNEEAGQIPMAFVVRQHGSTLSQEEVMDFVAKQVAPYKKIRRVAFISAIPKSAAGKILRKDLVNHALSGNSSKL